MSTNLNNLSKKFDGTDPAGFGGTWRDTRPVQVWTQAAANVLNATGTLTAAMLLGGIVTSTSGAAVTATLDTATIVYAALLAAVPSIQPTDYFEFAVVNTGANTFTIATATGWTDGGNGYVAVAAASSARFGVRITAANALTIFKVA